MKKLIFFLIAFGVTTLGLYSQNKTIKGRVISEDYEALPIVLIMVNDTVKVGSTDIKGFFKINIPIAEKKISFSMVGMDPTTIELVNKCNKIEVVMMYSYTYDFITLKRADRKRKKRFKKLPEIHKQAFEKSLFETEYACYNQKFEPFYITNN